MRRTSFDTMRCSIAQALDVVGDPWTLLVVREAFFGTTRFDDFQRNLSIPRATLSSRLSSLVEHGVLDRSDDPDDRRRHTYTITTKGRALDSVMVALLQWGDAWSDITEPPVTLLDLDSDQPIEPIYVDARSGTPLGELRIGRRINPTTDG
ncbi:winged helix-turn-helix transcriptional regulator [Ilumatobacter sp.]|uniref:winged helix-turn-helix transcriptional regulator n=1 Tax=Ilumatobacter sp. TaxID=1967498 RepID=UPI003B5177A1